MTSLLCMGCGCYFLQGSVTGTLKYSIFPYHGVLRTRLLGVNLFILKTLRMDMEYYVVQLRTEHGKRVSVGGLEERNSDWCCGGEEGWIKSGLIGT